MPLIRFDTVEGALDKAQKAKLSKALTSVVEEIVGPEMKGHTWVVINEAPEGNFFGPKTPKPLAYEKHDLN